MGRIAPALKRSQLLGKAGPQEIHSPIFPVMTLEPLERRILVRRVLCSVRTRFALASER